MNSIYEKSHPHRQQSHNAICFGRITQVFPEERMVEVKTFGGNGVVDDNHIPKCQWINMDGNPDGDESTSLPRVNSYGLVFFIGGEPFIFGFFSPLTGKGSAQLGEVKEEVNEGDKIFKTIGGNRIVLRAHGEIEIQSTDTCRTIYFPDRNMINTLCRNYEFRTDGGTVDWVNLGNRKTLYRRELRDSLSRTNIIIEERGSVDGAIISRTTLGAGSADGITQPVYQKTLQNTGALELFIRTPGASSGHKLNIAPSGATTLDIAGKAKVSIGADGSTRLDVGPGNAVLTISPDGKVSLEAKSDVSVKSSGKVSLEAKGDLTAKTDGAANIEASGKATIKAGGIDLDGGGGANGGVLVFPNAISDFTGLPIQAASGTVKASS